MNADWRVRRRRGTATTIMQDALLLALYVVLTVIGGIWWPAHVWIHIRPVWPDLVAPLIAPSLAGWLLLVLVVRRNLWP